MPVDDWTSSFEPRTPGAAQPLPAERRPKRIALDEQRSAHETFRITSADGVERDVSVTAIPLFAQAEEFVGIVAIFWRELVGCASPSVAAAAPSRHRGPTPSRTAA